MPRAKVDNPLFSRTDDQESTLKELDHQTSKVEHSGMPPQQQMLDEQLDESKSRNIPKFKTFREQLLVRLREDQLDYLTKLESSIMKGRSSQNKKERITKNSIIRAALDAIRTLKLDEFEIPNEEALLERIRQAIKRQTIKDEI